MTSAENDVKGFMTELQHLQQEKDALLNETTTTTTSTVTVPEVVFTATEAGDSTTITIPEVVITASDESGSNIITIRVYCNGSGSGTGSTPGVVADVRSVGSTLHDSSI